MDVHVDDPLCAAPKENLEKVWDLLRPHMQLRVNKVMEEGDELKHLGHVYKKVKNREICLGLSHLVLHMLFMTIL